METLICSNSPHSNAPRVSESRHNPAITPAKATTRAPLQSIPNTQPTFYVPASQESIASAQSSETNAFVQPHSSRSSIVSSQYTSNTALTSPSSSVESMPAYDGTFEGPVKLQYLRQKTPEHRPSSSHTREDSALFSPMSITYLTTTNGAKRTSSGHVKNAPSLPSTPLAPALDRRSEHRSRQHSVSSTGSRASELAATLKTRLGYAMAKVQYGWEHKSLQEVEQLAASQLSPNRFGQSFLNGRPNVLSRSTSDEAYESYHRENMDQTSPPPSKRHSAYCASYPQSLHYPTLAPNQAPPQLQPGIDLRSTAGSRQGHEAPKRRSNHAMSPPRTPISSQPHRPPTIRTETQTAEAEREALQALFQLGSPHGNQFSYSNAANPVPSNQTSPLRSDFSTPRRVDLAGVDSNAVARKPSSGGKIRSSESQ